MQCFESWILSSPRLKDALLEPLSVERLQRAVADGEAAGLGEVCFDVPLNQFKKKTKAKLE